MKSGSLNVRSLNINGIPHKRSGRAGGRSVSMIGMLVFLLAALLVLPSCFDDDTETVTRTQCHNGTTAAPGEMCPEPPEPPEPKDPSGYCEEEDEWNEDTMKCESTDVVEPTPTVVPTPVECPGGMIVNNVCEPNADKVGPGTCKDKDVANRHDSGDGDDRVMGTDGEDCIDGGKGNDTISGGGDADDIKGEAGNDILMGGAGNDKLDGGAGNDKLDGGAGDDELTGGPGDNELDGGEGADIAIFLGAMQVTVDLIRNEAVVQHTAPQAGTDYLSFGDEADGTGSDDLMNIENIKGTHGDDSITGDDNANLLKGLDGKDAINGGAGDDTILPNRPAEADDMANPVANVANTAATPEAETDGADVVDGGAGNDTISYEGEYTAVTVNLGSPIPAEAGPDTVEGTPDDVIAHVAVTVADGSVPLKDGTNATVVETVDMIKAVLDDDEDLVSTIENVTGGFGGDTLTGDARANTLKGGPGVDTLDGSGGNDKLDGGEGNDSLTGGAGNDTLDGGPGTETTLAGGDGDDTYVGVIETENPNVSENANEGNDTLYYAPFDDPATDDADESTNGIGSTSAVITPSEVETVFGTQNADTLTAATTGVTILGLGGDDTLVGASGDDTLVGCAGENTLTGGGGSNFFRIFNGGENDAADTITDFTTGADNAVTDEIHLEGFDSGTAEARLIPGNSTQAGVYVDDVLVAIVGSADITAVTEDPNADPPVAGKTQAKAILDALGKTKSNGDSIVRIVAPDSAKCNVTELADGWRFSL